MKTCIIDTGGGLRGIYGAGVLDRCMEENFLPDCCIGVSAGSANIAAFTAGQKGRNIRFYRDYSFRKEYMSFTNFVKTGSYIGLDYIYRTLSNEGGEDPLDYDVISRYDGELSVVATDAKTGEPVYFGKEALKRNDYGVICASCAIPAVCRAYKLNGGRYYDGGVSDPVPVEYALSLGCDRIILILTRPTDFVMDSKLENAASVLLAAKYPATSEKLRSRAGAYAGGVKKALELQSEGKCLILAPDDCCGVETLTRDKDKLGLLYDKGYSDANNIFKGDFLSCSWHSGK